MCVLSPGECVNCSATLLGCWKSPSEASTGTLSGLCPSQIFLLRQSRSVFAERVLRPLEILATEHLAQMERTSGNGNISTNYPCQKEIKPTGHTCAILTGMSILWKYLFTRFASFPMDDGFCGCRWRVMTGLPLKARSVKTDSPAAGLGICELLLGFWQYSLGLERVEQTKLFNLYLFGLERLKLMSKSSCHPRLTDDYLLLSHVFCKMFHLNTLQRRQLTANMDLCYEAVWTQGVSATQNCKKTVRPGLDTIVLNSLSEEYTTSRVIINGLGHSRK